MLARLFSIHFLCLFMKGVLGDPFWISVELLRVDWREGCLTTAGCSQPRFKLLEDMLPVSEKVSVSWPISEHFVQDSARPFVSHWTSGVPDDVTLSCQVVGTDPTYGFPRICDQTASVRVFQEQVMEALDQERTRARRGQHQASTTSAPEDEGGKHLIEVRGKCFNATLAVQKHTERCPWCPDPNEITLIGHELPEDFATVSFLEQLRGDEQFVHIGLLSLAAIAVVASAACGCLLVAYVRQRRNFIRQVTVKPRFHPYNPTGVHHLKTDDDTRYDMPWEQSRPLTYWLTSSKGSECTTTSPLDSASSLPYAYRVPPVPTTGVPQTTIIPSSRLYQTISPNSSIHHDDSGLESV